MAAQCKGWFANLAPAGQPGEGSIGEGLSKYLGREYALTIGYTYGQVGNLYMQSPRLDFVSQTNPSALNQAGYACTVLFLSYLRQQFGYALPLIIANGATTLSGVYQNLTGDSNNPFPFFKYLLDIAYPGTSPILAPVDADNPFPLIKLTITGGKTSFGRDEVGSKITAQFGQPYTYTQFVTVDVEGFPLSVLQFAQITLTGAATTFDPTVTILPLSLNPSSGHYQTDSQIVPQRVSYPANITFSGLSAFPAPTQSTNYQELDATLFLPVLPNAPSSSFKTSTSTNLEFLAGADPYFENITKASPSSTADNQYYLSNSLRVFTIAPRYNSNPLTHIPGFLPPPTFQVDTSVGGTEADDTPGAYTFLKDLLDYLNQYFTNPDNKYGDPFSSSFPLFP
jgi:hypothetical protein